MRHAVVIALTTLALAACGPSPSDTPPPAATPKPAEAMKPAATPAAPTAAPAQAAAPKAPPPEGDCGDQSKLEPDQRVANTAHWTTASEQDSFGFDVFRATAEKGPFDKITKSPVLGAGTSDETHKYEYKDDTIDPCKEYWYYVEQISTKGEHEKVTPVFHASPKRRARGTPADGAS